jgi:hypothetical protein
VLAALLAEIVAGRQASLPSTNNDGFNLLYHFTPTSRVYNGYIRDYLAYLYKGNYIPIRQNMEIFFDIKGLIPHFFLTPH